MRKLAGDQVDDGHQVFVRSESPRSGDGGLDLGVDRLGGRVGQAKLEAVVYAGQLIPDCRP